MKHDREHRDNFGTLLYRFRAFRYVTECYRKAEAEVRESDMLKNRLDKLLKDLRLKRIESSVTVNWNDDLSELQEGSVLIHWTTDDRIYREVVSSSEGSQKLSL